MCYSFDRSPHFENLPAHHVDLGVIANLHILTLRWHISDHQSVLTLIVDQLQNHAITRVLQEFAIGLQVESSDELLRMHSPRWEDIDVTLSSLPKLQKVLFWVEMPVPPSSSAELQLVIQKFLPLLADRKILSVGHRRHYAGRQ